jgi:hypothetical protein
MGDDHMADRVIDFSLRSGQLATIFFVWNMLRIINKK